MAGNDLQTRYTNIEDQLRNSPTSYAPNTVPTSSDLSLDRRLSAVDKQIDDQIGKQQRNKWYGPSVSTEEAPPKQDGLIMGAIKAIQRPLNAIAGTAQYALGKGTAPTLGESISKSMDSGLTFGNVLKQEGLPWGVSAPLGFALDIMFDPVNWLTMGTEALIPRVGMGAVRGFAEKAGIEGAESGLRGAAEGALTGLTSGLERKGAKILNSIPFAKQSETYANLAERLGNTAIKGVENYDKATGVTAYDQLGKSIFDFGTKPKGWFGNNPGLVGNKAEELIASNLNKMTKAGNLGDKTVEFFKYSPSAANRATQAADLAINVAKKFGANLYGKVDTADFASALDFNKLDARIVLKASADDLIKEAEKVVNQAKLFEEAPSAGVLIRDQGTGNLLEGFQGVENAPKISVANTYDNALTFINMAKSDKQFSAAIEALDLKDLTAAYKETNLGESGVKFFDDWMKRIRSTTVGDLGQGKLGTVAAANEMKINDAIKAAEEGAQKTNEAWSLAKAGSRMTGAIKDIQEVKIADLHPFAGVLDALEVTTSIFKAAKVAMNVGSHIVAAAGNLFMGAMQGLPVQKIEYLKSIWRASRVVKGKLGSTGIYELFYNDVNMLIDMAENNPTTFKRSTGMNPREIANKVNAANIRQTFAQVEKEMVRKLEMVSRGVINTERESLKVAAKRAADFEKQASKSDLIDIRKEGGSYSTPTMQTLKNAEQGPIKASEEFGNISSAELVGNKHFDSFKKAVEEGATKDPSNLGYKLLNGLFNKMPRAYEHIDQSYKLGTLDYLTRVGLTRAELTVNSRFVHIDEAVDLLEPVKSGGELLYRFKPGKAAEIAGEAYMNYAAMPDFVKVMRSLQVIGSNFYSFQYAIMAKTAKTLMNNPSVFNKVSFMLNEISGERTPQEKKALTEKYNLYLNSPTVVKLFGGMNLDLKNYIPWVTMNMFNPSQKTYDNSAQGQIMKRLDNLPFFQTPTGQVFKDYILQPMVMSGSKQPIQGQFGQSLYPSFDENTAQPIKVGLGTQTFYAGQTFADTLIPGTVNYLGFLNAFTDLPVSVVEKLPYRMRQSAFSTQGKSSVGATTKENAFIKSLRTAMGMAGVPIYPLDITKTSTE